MSKSPALLPGKAPQDYPLKGQVVHRAVLNVITEQRDVLLLPEFEPTFVLTVAVTIATELPRLVFCGLDCLHV